VTSDLKLGLMLGYWTGQGPEPGAQIAAAQAAEDAGFDSVWTAESYGSDAFTPLAWLGSHTSRIQLSTGLVQLSARTPAATAMTALTMDRLSGGRLQLGLGVSGPQVVEGWYGVPFPKPLARTREYVGILRDIWRREGPVTSDGEHYPLPYPGGTGLGKPLKANCHPLRPDIPVLLGAEGPRTWRSPARSPTVAAHLLPRREGTCGLRRRAGRARPGFEIACPVTGGRRRRPAEGDRLGQAHDGLSTSGGMGAKGQELPPRRRLAVRLRGGGAPGAGAVSSPATGTAR
jgi:F420-dependent oxidoreductase-like protein